jgi:hypothetical protein
MMAKAFSAVSDCEDVFAKIVPMPWAIRELISRSILL